MIEVRRLKNEDRPALARLHAVVYNFRRNFSKENDEHQPDPLDDPSEWSWGVFDSGKLISATMEHQYMMRFDGHDVRLSGVGGVGTLPEARKGGFVRATFEKFLKEDYENGVMFSNLTPFSHEFYRRFGYEIACARNNVSIPTGEFSDLKTKGSFTQFFPGDDTSVLNEIHRAYISGINHGICRDYWPDNRAWKIFTREDPYSSGTFLFVWKDENGKARSYIKYKDIEEDGDHSMSVNELAFMDRDSLYGILSFVSGLTAQYTNFKWMMPVFIDPTDFISDLWEVEQHISPRDMSRVVNVKAALEKMRRPEGEGSYTVEVEDEIIKANSGKFLVEYGGEESRVTKTNKTPDLICDIPVLSQLITGYRSLENIMITRKTGFELCGNEKNLKKVFTLRPQHITEYF